MRAREVLGPADHPVAGVCGDHVEAETRETHGERVVPGWLEAFPNRMRIFVHQLPVRAQIDLPIQEQLIVEYYSKK